MAKKHSCKLIFELIAESRQADHYWCPECGAYKRVPNGNFDDDTETTIIFPTRHKEK